MMDEMSEIEKSLAELAQKIVMQETLKKRKMLIFVEVQEEEKEDFLVGKDGKPNFNYYGFMFVTENYAVIRLKKPVSPVTFFHEVVHVKQKTRRKRRFSYRRSTPEIEARCLGRIYQQKYGPEFNEIVRRY